MLPAVALPVRQLAHTIDHDSLSRWHGASAGFEKALEGQLAAGAAYSETITWAKVWGLIRVPSNLIIILQVGQAVCAGGLKGQVSVNWAGLCVLGG